MIMSLNQGLQCDKRSRLKQKRNIILSKEELFENRQHFYFAAEFAQSICWTAEAILDQLTDCQGWSSHIAFMSMC